MYLATLENFDPNPWQPRQVMDEAALGELAANIQALKPSRRATRGLLQLPAARLVDGDNKPVPMSNVVHLIPARYNDITAFLKSGEFRLQLGLGHRRHAAFQKLAPTDPDYTLLPFEMQEFTDEEMFKIAMSENMARVNLSPIEIAQAMLRYRDDFGRVSSEIGHLFGVSDSTVRNLIRLLDLPAEPRQALAEGRMSQGAGRVWLTLDGLPKGFLKSAEYTWPEKNRPSMIRQDALAGFLASGLEGRVTGLIQREGVNLSSARFKKAEFFEGEGIYHPDCKTCLANVKREKTDFCLMRTCFDKKQALWRAGYLVRASEAVGLPSLEAGKTDRITNFYYSGRETILASARTIQCPNLCVHHNPKMSAKIYPHLFPDVKQFPDIILVCSKMEQHCICLKAHKAGVEITVETGAITLPSGAVIEDIEGAPHITADKLREVNKDLNAQKRQAREEIKVVRAEAARRFCFALAGGHVGAYRELLSNVHGFGHGTKYLTLDELLLAVAAHLVDRQFQYENDAEYDVGGTLRRLNRWLKGMGMEMDDDDPLKGGAEPVSTETPQIPTVEHRPLVEILDK